MKIFSEKGLQKHLLLVLLPSRIFTGMFIKKIEKYFLKTIAELKIVFNFAAPIQRVVFRKLIFKNKVAESNIKCNFAFPKQGMFF